MLFVGSCRDQFKHCLLFLTIILNCKKLEQVYNSIPVEFPLKLTAEQYKLKPKGSTRLVPHLKLQDKSTSGLKHYSVASVSLRSKLVSHFNAFGLSQLNFVNASGCLAYTFYGMYAQPSIAGPIPASSCYTSICEQHFENDAIVQTNSHKKLKLGVLPTKCLPKKVKEIKVS